MHVLLLLPNIESCSDICLLQKMLDAIGTSSCNLHLYDIDSNHYGPILTSVIIKKLPEEFHLQMKCLLEKGT